LLFFKALELPEVDFIVMRCFLFCLSRNKIKGAKRFYHCSVTWIVLDQSRERLLNDETAVDLMSLLELPSFSRKKQNNNNVNINGHWLSIHPGMTWTSSFPCAPHLACDDPTLVS
jgi:hypothetical protein